MPGCCAIGCSNRSEKGFRLYRFPAQPERRKIWENRVNRLDWKASRSSFLCQEHFTHDDFENKRADGLRKLRWNAVPTIFLDYNSIPDGRKIANKRNIPVGSAYENKENDSLADHSYFDLTQTDEPSGSSDENESDGCVQKVKKMKEEYVDEDKKMKEYVQEVKIMKECVQEVIKIQEDIAQLEKELQNARKRKSRKVTALTKGGSNLTKEERVEIILLSGREGWTYRRVAEQFNELHPERDSITHNTVARLVRKFRATGSVLDQSHCG